MKHRLFDVLKRYQPKIIWILFLLLLIPLIQPLFPTGIIKTYDGPAHLFRIAAFHTALLNHDIPPSWASGLAYGFGSPVFLFNWSFPYWLAQPFVFLNFTIIDSLKIVEGASIILSFFTMTVLLRSWFSTRSSLVGGLFYCWALFRTYLLYTSGALGMEVSFVIWPLLFLSIVWIANNRVRHGVLLGSISVGLLMLTHQVMFLMILPLWLGFLGIYLWSHHRSVNTGALSIIFFLTGLALSAFFWLPAIMEKQYINISKYTESIYLRDFQSLKILFLQPKFFQLYGDDWFKHIYAIGWIHLLTPVLWLIVSGQQILKKGLKYSTSLRVQAISFIFFLISIYLITPYSEIIWKTMPMLSSFIYPIRFEALTIFCGSILIAGFLEKIKQQWIFVVALSLAIILLNYPSIPFFAERINWPDKHFYYGDSTSDATGEFLPKWSNTHHFFDDTRWERQPLARIISGKAIISAMQKTSNSAHFIVDSSTVTTVIVNQLYFPGWVITTNEGSLPIRITNEGEMQISLPVGHYVVHAQFTTTPIRTVSRLISFMTVVILLIIYLPIKMKRLRKQKKQRQT